LNTPASARYGSSIVRVLLAIAVIGILTLSVYVFIAVPSTQNQLSSVQNQNNQLEAELSNLQNQVAVLGSQLRTSSSTQTSALAFEAIACVSVTPKCQTIASNASYVYAIGLTNTGTASLPMGYSVYLSFKDGTRMTFFGFNTTLPSSFTPGGRVYLTATSWPQYTNATSKLAAGDQVGIAVVIGDYQTAVPVHVLSCNTTTTTFLNATRTQTATLTNCA